VESRLEGGEVTVPEVIANKRRDAVSTVRAAGTHIKKGLPQQPFIITRS